MALPSTAVWEVRASTGNDANGGFYNSARGGTDYSQQNSPQLTVNDVVTNGTTTVTSSTGGFTAAMVGNGINIAGTIYEITARASTNSITIDRTAGAASGQTGNVGGALATLSKTFSNAVAGSPGVPGANTIYATGTFTLTSAVTLLASFCKFIGYNTSRGDGGYATVTSSTSTVDLIQLGAGECLIQNIKTTHTGSTRGVAFRWNQNNAFGIKFYNCVCDGCLNWVRADNQGTEWQGSFYAAHCEVKNCTGEGVRAIGAQYYDCWIHDNASYGHRIGYIGGASLAAVRTVFSKNSVGIYAFANTYFNIDLTNCVIHNNTGDGISVSDANADLIGYVLENCIITSNGRYGINNNTGNTINILVNRNNAYYNNSSGNFNNMTAGSGDVSLSGDPFTNAASGNFSLNNTAGAGAACKAVGFPGVSLFGTGYQDIGVLQSQSTGGTRGFVF